MSTMAAQLKEIVDRLNADPFSMDLSLVSFDEKEPFELMEVLKKVLVHLDPKHDVDIREEQPDAMYQRIGEFLHVLGYRCSYDMEFQQGVMSGDKRTVHPVLYWLLSNLEQLKKRAYLANYCVNLEVPEEFLRDESVYELYQHYKELQSQFKTTHAHLEQQRPSKVSPAELQREVAQLDAEREQLTSKIQQFRTRSAHEENFQVLLQVTSMLRKEQEEEARLVERLHEQRMQLEQMEQIFLERSRRLHEMRTAQDSDGEGGAEMMLKVLRTELDRNRDALARTQREHTEKSERLSLVAQTLSEPGVSKQQIDDMEEELALMQQEIEGLEKTVNDNNAPDSRLSVYKQQANLVSKKKEIALGNQKSLEEERDGLSKQLSVKEREYEHMKGHKFMKRDEFKSYAASLRDKSTKFKRLKAELGELRRECAVLTRTEQILQAKEDPRAAGMRQTEAALEKASAEKANVDAAKGQTLDEISQVVTRITSQLKEKKNKLAPQIKALRSVRQEFQMVEQRYLEKKAVYDQMRFNLDADLSKVANDVQRLVTESGDMERRYFELNVQIVGAEAKLSRAHKEVKCLKGEMQHSADFVSLSAQYTSELARMEQVSRDLRKQQKAVKETHTENLVQKQAFQQLETLMRMKLKVSQQEVMALSNTREGLDMLGARPAIDVSTGAVNRMIIGD